MNGEISSPSRILRNPLYWMAPKPAEAITAPVIPPISACDELLGMPKYHVIKFQAIAANSAAKITVVPLLRSNGSAIPLVIVCATPVNVIAPTKFIVDRSEEHTSELQSR